MKSILFVICLLLAVIVTNAQYRVNKYIYNAKDYTFQAEDPYNPGEAGMASFFIPGLGQMISGEVVRGVAILGGFVGIGVSFLVVNPLLDEKFSAEGGFAAMSALGVIGFVILTEAVLYIWSIFDAVKVAKINNLAWRDNQSAMNMRLQPYIGHIPNTQTKTVGLTFQVSF